MKTYLFFIKSLLVSLNLCIAQVKEVSEPIIPSITEHRLGLYGEIAGVGGMFSGNIEYQFLFKDKRFGTYIRGGFGIVIFWGDVDYRPMVEVGFLSGKNQRYLDIGVGTAVYGNREIEGYFTTIRFGYLYQGKNGFIFRIAPMLLYTHGQEGFDSKIYPWFGIGFGYTLPISLRK